MQDDTTGQDAGGTDDPVQAGLEQFQRAALDAVRAARSMLEAAEAVLQDPEAARVVADTVSSFARNATETVADFAGTWVSQHDRRTATPEGREEEDPDDDGPEPGVEHIPVH